jgi:hypothetical protein
MERQLNSSRGLRSLTGLSDLSMSRVRKEAPYPWQILGEAVADRGHMVDIDMIFVATIDDLEAAHLRLLEVLETASRYEEPRRHMGC